LSAELGESNGAETWIGCIYTLSLFFIFIFIFIFIFAFRCGRGSPRARGMEMHVTCEVGELLTKKALMAAHQITQDQFVDQVVDNIKGTL
jgi:hypothetical protein